MSNCSGTTKDLDKAEELVLVKISLNPDSTGESIKEELETDVESFSRCLDTLLERGYVEMSDDDEEMNWRVTDLGRMALQKFSDVLGYDLKYAIETDQDKETINSLKKQKLMFDRALNAASDRAGRR